MKSRTALAGLIVLFGVIYFFQPSGVEPAFTENISTARVLPATNSLPNYQLVNDSLGFQEGLYMQNLRKEDVITQRRRRFELQPIDSMPDSYTERLPESIETGITVFKTVATAEKQVKAFTSRPGSNATRFNLTENVTAVRIESSGNNTVYTVSKKIGNLHFYVTVEASRYVEAAESKAVLTAEEIYRSLEPYQN